MTKFKDIYDRFFGKITDDMYFEWTPENTINDLRNILMDALPMFEFPRFDLYAFDLKDFEVVRDEEGAIIGYEDNSEFNIGRDLLSEEINILAILMYNTWLQRQIASIENIRMKYSGQEFKLTSQANHLSKLISLKQEAERQDRHAQRLYKRRFLSDSGYQSNWSQLVGKSCFD